jgi:predicted polyphosphate/ATP-dependent NAD kinase
LTGGSRAGSPTTRRIGLIVNPVAGIGGRVGLKGSDGRDVQERALAMGAVPEAPGRAAETLRTLGERASARFALATYPGEMGGDVARSCGCEPVILGSIRPGATTGADTTRAAADLQGWGAELIVFAGGDGTARDVFAAIGSSLPVIGIPAGVKVHSSVFAVNPRRAAELIEAFLDGRTRLREMEVMDLDEDLFRQGVVSAHLFGYMTVPYARNLVQGAKAASTADSSSARSAAFGVLDLMDEEPETLFILGPGSTVKALGDELGIDKTLLGVDVVRGGQLVAKDVGERELLDLVTEQRGSGGRSKIVVTVIGGQGSLFGRGNQQLSPAVLRAVGRQNILVLATADKLHALGGPLVVDTGDPDCDRALSGYIRVITGEREQVVWRVTA